MSDLRLLVATGTSVFIAEPPGRMQEASGLEGEHPTCLAAGRGGDTAWCGTRRGGVFRSDDGGRSWSPAGLPGEHVTALAVDPVRDGVVWAGTEPSALWRLGPKGGSNDESSSDEGGSWERLEGLDDLPSSSEWAFPPRPETHHVRWIACHPDDHGRLWLAIEAGALVRTPDGGASWQDRVEGGPYDTHELAIHPQRPETLRVSAGDGYYESPDGGRTWRTPREGLEVGYLRSVAVDPGDPDVVVVSASARARTAYVAGHADGRLFRRQGDGPWERVLDGWPDPPDTIAPLLAPGANSGELWAADERGLHRSGDGGRSWERVATFPGAPSNLRGLAPLVTGA